MSRGGVSGDSDGDLAPIAVLVLLMAMQGLEAALLPGADDGTGASRHSPRHGSWR
jgi:hypothetical protein